MNRARWIGFQKEYLVLRKYESEGYLVYRVPMSNMPFDIVAVNPARKEILFIEVKSRKSSLSERQRRFKAVIEMHEEWEVKYIVEKVD